MYNDQSATFDFVSFESFFHTEIRILRCMGLSYFNCVFSNKKETEKWWQKITPLIGLIIMSLLISMEVMKIIQVISISITYAAGIFTAMLSGMLCMFKAVRCWTHRKELFNFLQQLKASWESAYANKLLTKDELNNALYSRSLRNYVMVLVFALAFSYAYPVYVGIVKHFVYHSEEYFFTFSRIMYPVKYPFKINTFSRYFACLLFEQVSEILAIVYWLCGDILFIQLTTHVSIQCKVLINRLNNFNKDNTSSEEENCQQLINIISQHNQLFLLCKWLQRFFSPIAFFVTLINGLNLCFSLYRVDQQISQGNWSHLIENTIHLVNVFGQTLLYCKQADMLTEKLGEVNNAIYCSNWIQLNKKLKLILLIMMRRAQKEYRFTIYGIITLNLAQFSKIVNTAMSYFTLLRSIG
ncbi:GSCOCT00009250001.3-RA-CDS, partial [Cotesia congregata]